MWGSLSSVQLSYTAGSGHKSPSVGGYRVTKAHVQMQAPTVYTHEQVTLQDSDIKQQLWITRLL